MIPTPPNDAPPEPSQSPSPSTAPESPRKSGTFTFQAQADDGQRLSGTIDAADADAVLDRLQGMGLRVIDVTRVEATPDPSANGGGKSAGNAHGNAAGRPLRAGDFAAFNQQFAQLTRAGLPVEHGLRLIAGDMRRGRLARTIEQVAEELERGTSLGEAFDKHRGQFPTLYGRLVDAGVRGGDLPGVLLGLGRHLELVQRLRAALWRSVSYPLMVFVGLCIVLIFLGMFVLPQFQDIFQGIFEARRSMPFTTTGRPTGPAPSSLPLVTRGLMVLTALAPWLLALLVLAIVGGPIAWAMLRRKGKDSEVLDRFVLPMPLVGPVMRLNLVARWCDALRLGVAAGLDLPASVELAGDVTGSPSLRHDGRGLVALLESGKPLSTPRPDNKLLPATVPAAIELASGHHDLPGTLETLSEMYERQAESRLASLPAIITPLLVILVAGVTAFVIAGLLLPMMRALQSL
jgi:type IV pilus assembly protein PilC